MWPSTSRDLSSVTAQLYVFEYVWIMNIRESCLGGWATHPKQYEGQFWIIVFGLDKSNIWKSPTNTFGVHLAGNPRTIWDSLWPTLGSEELSRKNGNVKSFRVDLPLNSPLNQFWKIDEDWVSKVSNKIKKGVPARQIQHLGEAEGSAEKKFPLRPGHVASKGPGWAMGETGWWWKDVKRASTLG